MASARVPLPQFQGEDLRTGALVQKLRALTRAVELGYQRNGAATPAPAWLFGTGAPSETLGDEGQFYLDTATGDVYLKRAGQWAGAGTLSKSANDGTTKPSTSSVPPSDVAALADLLQGEGVIRITQGADNVVIDAPFVNGGFMADGAHATRLQLRHGPSRDLPRRALDGEALFAADTQELFFGNRLTVMALRVALGNVIGLLKDDKIDPALLPDGADGGVRTLASPAELEKLNAAQGDVAFVLDNGRHEAQTYIRGRYAWQAVAVARQGIVAIDAPHTLGEGDDDAVLRADGATMIPITLDPFLPVGFYCQVVQDNAFPVYFIEGDASARVNTLAPGHKQSAGKASRVHLHKLADGQYQIYGDLAPVGYGATYRLDGAADYGGFAALAGAADSERQTVSYRAGEAVGGHRAVAVRAGAVFYADNARIDDASRAIGVTTGAAAAGAAAEVVTYGEVAETTWAWTPDAPVFVGANGALTQTPPTSGFVGIVGYPVTAQRLFVDPKPAIFLH